MKNIGLLIFLFLSLSSLSFSQKDTMIIETTYLKNPDTCLIYLPSNYTDNTNLLPLVFFLHGYGGNPFTLNQMIDLQSYADKYGFVIVSPSGQNAWYFDSPIKRDSKWETFFIEQLYPAINKKYNVDTSNIFITGLSMGGHGALYLFLRHQSLFRSAGSSSGTLNLNASTQKFLSLSNLLGEYKKNEIRFNAFSCINLPPSIQFSDKKIIFDCGTSDILSDCNNDFKKTCDSLHIQATYISSAGRHNSEYWQKSFDYHFVFFSQQIIATRRPSDTN